MNALREHLETSLRNTLAYLDKEPAGRPASEPAA
jgi:hypothetical protein